MLHGCQQSGAEAALGTDVNAYADRAGFVALSPEQSTRDNVQLCWNWFLPGHQSRGLGEPAAIARITEQVLSGRHGRGRPRLDRNRVHVMGLSAGGAMAGVLAATYPDIYASAGIHSAPQYGAARSTLTAVMAMRNGGPDPERQGRLAHAAMGPRARVVPVMVVQGGADTTVWAINGDSVVRQWLATSRLADDGQAGVSYAGDSYAGDGDAGDEGVELDFARPDTSEVLSSPGGLSYEVRCWNDDAGRPARHLSPGPRDWSRFWDWTGRLRDCTGRVRDSSSGLRDSSGRVRDSERSGSSPQRRQPDVSHSSGG